jgi:hypothetical protein
MPSRRALQTFCCRATWFECVGVARWAGYGRRGRGILGAIEWKARRGRFDATRGLRWWKVGDGYRCGSDRHGAKLGRSRGLGHKPVGHGRGHDGHHHGSTAHGVSKKQHVKLGGRGRPAHHDPKNSVATTILEKT